MQSACRLGQTLPCIVFGAGGHATVVLDAMLAAGQVPQGVLDHDRARRGRELLGIPILGGDDLLPELIQRGVQWFVIGVGSTGNSSRRRHLFEFACSQGLRPLTVRHPSAICSPAAEIAAGAQVLAAAVVNAGARIEANAIVNTAAVVEHDCHVGPHAHIAPGVRLGGNVIVGAEAHVGIGATVRQQIHIGSRSLVGAGAVVVEDVAAGSVVIGVPARPKPQRAVA